MKSRLVILGTLMSSLFILGCPGNSPTQTTSTSEGTVKNKPPKNNATPEPRISPQIIKSPAGETGFQVSPSPSASPTPATSPTPTVQSTDPPPPGDWFGRVLGVDGKAAAGVTVKGFLVDGDGTSPLSTTTDDKGMFTLKDPGGKALNLEASQSDSVKAFQPNVAATAKNVTMQLAKTGTISGKITLSGGAAAADVTVTIPGTPYTAKTDANGNYSLANVPPGTFAVHAEKAGAGAINITNVNVTSGGTAGVESKTLTAVVPTIASVSPTAGGPTVDLTIKGDNFTGTAVSVVIGTKDCTDVKVVDAKTITAKVPAGAASAKLVVKVDGKSSDGVDFKVIGSYFFDAASNKKLLVGDTFKYKVTAQDASGAVLTTAPGTWSSTNTAVVDVAQDGTATAKGAGDATIQIASGTSKATLDIHVDAKLSVSTVAGSGTAGSADGNGTAATFNFPTGIAVDDAHNLYVTDNNGNAIRKIAPNGDVTLIAGSGSTTHTFNDGSGSNAGFYFPENIIWDQAGSRLIVADQANYRIRSCTTGGNVLTIAGGGAEIANTPGLYVDANGASARFYAPSDVALFGGNIFVADYYNHRIRKIAANGDVTTYAGTSTVPGEDGGGLVDNANPLNAQFKFPSGLAFDAAGNLYVADQGNAAIRKIAANGGAVSTLAGGAPGFVDGTKNSAEFRGPGDLVVDPSGTYLYVSDTTNHAIRRVRIATGEVTTVAGLAPTGSNGAGGGAPPDGSFADGTDARFNQPNGLVIDGNTLYIADAQNHRIRKIVLP